MTSLLLHLGGGLCLENAPRTKYEVIFSTSSSSVAYRRAQQAGRQIKLCAVRGSLGGNLGRRVGRGQAVCKGGSGQNEHGIVRRSSAGNGASETDQVERLASIGGDGGIGNGTGDSGGNGGDSEGGGDGSGPLVPAAGLWSRYTELLDRHPLIVKSITAGLLNAVADFVCQILIEKGTVVDLRRLLSFVAIGVFMSGPGLHYWYGMLSKFITVPGMGGVFLRTAADQIVFTPLGVIGFFVVLLNLEGRQAELADKLQKDVVEVVIANWKVWIPFQIVNFGFVPPQLQVAAAGILGMVWSVFISYKGHT
ncbi:hypothetical protein KC19_3G188300 [Ceratodon purpureus]|uniref:MPV17 n=1 Tax=Ceratodon purpureus TaxID=3225 RepID=A0A8T0IMG4_CERPU|nr:hypothetical protein KC19_3G188300 [Ceratodon purpureus]